MEIVVLCLFAFLAGLCDSVVGGGGLIQLPALMAAYPLASLPMLLGTNKISSIFGTGFAIFRYRKNMRLPWGFLLPLASICFLGSYLGAKTVSYLSRDSIRPVVLGILIAVTLYTVWQKSLGLESKKFRSRKRRIGLAVGLFTLIAFYDGFLGPGTGGFLIFVFVTLLGFNFLEASASSKVLNFSANLAALTFFVPSGDVMFRVGLPMAIANILGSYVGTSIAIKRGSPTIRRLFLVIVILTIAKVGWDIARGL